MVAGLTPGATAEAKRTWAGAAVAVGIVLVVAADGTAAAPELAPLGLKLVQAAAAVSGRREEKESCLRTR